jgi:hypothetical protein
MTIVDTTPRGGRVRVTEDRCLGLVDTDATTYVNPVQTEEQARSLIALLATGTPDGVGPWRLAIAGGQRVIVLEAQR